MSTEDAKISSVKSFLRRTQYSLALSVICFQSCLEQILSTKLDHSKANNMAFVVAIVLTFAMVETSIFVTERLLKNGKT